MTVVLAGSYAETAKFAGAQRLANIRHIVNRATLAEMSPYVASEVYILPSFYARPDKHGILEELNATRRQFVGMRRHEITMEELAELFGTRGGAIPAPPAQTEIVGQTSIEDALSDAPAEPAPAPTPEEHIAALEAAGVLEPEGFELSDNPEVQVQQILRSAAGAPQVWDAKPADPDADAEFLKMIGES